MIFSMIIAYSEKILSGWTPDHDGKDNQLCIGNPVYDDFSGLQHPFHRDAGDAISVW